MMRTQVTIPMKDEMTARVASLARKRPESADLIRTVGAALIMRYPYGGRVEFIHLTALFEEEVERCLAFDPLVGEQLDSARARLYGELPKLYRLFDGLDANVLRNWVGNLSTYEFSHMPSAAIILETVERILSGRGFEGKLTYDQLRERTAGLAREIGGRYTSVRTLLDFVYLGETDEEARHQLAEVVHQVCAGLVSRSKLTDGFAARFKKAAARAVPVREPR